MTFDPNARPAPDQPSYAALLRQLQEAQNENRQLKRTKKFGLVWEDKPDAQVERVFLEAPLLCEDREKAVVTDEDAVNHVLINGDNFHALTALRATHTGKVDVIYIDPPYNTGNKDFIYNDDYVDAEDGYRHSKWLSFMEKRLRLARELLSDTGFIFVSIDDNEQARLKLLLDTVFGTKRFLVDVIWQSRTSVSNDALISMNHNHTLVYGMNPEAALREARAGNLFRESPDPSGFANPDNDTRGPWKATPFDAPNVRRNLSYEITNPNTGVVFVPPQGRCWRTTKDEYERLLEDRRIVFGKAGTARPQQKRFLSEAVGSGTTLTSLWTAVGTTTEGSRTIKSIFGELAFTNPKPVELLKKIIHISTAAHEAVVLDFFAGSGTTAHAVAELNKADGGRRQCILVTDGGKTEETGHSGANSNSNAVHIAEEITYERVRRVLTGQDWADGKEHEPLGGNLRYFNVHMEDIQSYSERDEAAAFAPFTRSHASIATSAFTVVEEKRVDTVFGLPVDYVILSTPTGEDEVKYVVAVHTHDYELAELGEWFAALPEDTDVTIMGHWLHEVEWVKENTARIKLVDVTEQVSASRKHAKSLVYT